MNTTKAKLPPKGEIYRLLVSLKKDICDDYRADEFDDSNTPSMCVTIACNEEVNWNYQTGDNSFTGGAYGLPHWAVITLTRTSNSNELADDVLNQLADLMA